MKKCLALIAALALVGCADKYTPPPSTNPPPPVGPKEPRDIDECPRRDGHPCF